MVALLYLVAALLCAQQALSAWKTERTHPAARAFTALAAHASLTFGLFSLYLSGVEILGYAYAACGAFLPLAVLRVVERLLGDNHPTPTYRRLRAATAFAVLLYGVSEPLLGRVPRASIPEVLLGIATLLASGVPLWRLVAEARAAPLPAVRARLRILQGNLAASLLFFAMEMGSRAFTPLDSGSRAAMGPLKYAWALQGSFPPMGVALFTAFLYVLHRVVVSALDVREIVARAFSIVAAGAGLVAVQELILDTFGEPGTFWTHQTFLLSLVAWAFLAIYEPVRRALNAQAGQWFNLPGWRFQMLLDEVDQALAKVLTLDGLDGALLEPLHASGRAPLVTLYLWEGSQGLYRLALQRGVSERPLMRTIGARPFTDGFLRGELMYTRGPLERAVRRGGPSTKEATDALRVLDAMAADVTLPFLSGGLVLGWLNLTASDHAEGFTPEEVRRLRRTADRAGTVLENLGNMEQLAEQRRLAALGTMAAGLAHEIRNPLAGIKGAAQYLQGQPADAELRDFLGVIVDEVNRLNDVVTQFLDYARPLKVTREPTPIEGLVSSVLDWVRREGLAPEVSLRAELQPDLPELALDRDKIRQVLLNLVQNAVQAVGNAGEVVVRAELRAARGPGNSGEEQLALSVSDTGPGVSPEDLEKLFIPFFTTKPGGTGLGLAISRRLVQAHGGDLNVRSAQGGPTTFTVHLPRYPAEPALPLLDLTAPRSPSMPR